MAVAAIHPRFMASVPAAFFPSLATAQASVAVQDPFGHEFKTWADVATLKDIPAIKAPLSAIERQAAQYTATDEVFHVLLKGAYPGITTRHRASIDGEVFDIDAAETDPFGTVTRLRVRSVEV